MFTDRNNTTNSYDDIIDHPHHVSTQHPRMSMTDRAAQFSPFAALTGYGDVIKETARVTDRKPELSESEKTELDYKLQKVCDYPGEKPTVSITYFVPDLKKAGGSYRTISGQIKKIDDYKKQVVLLDKSTIDIDCILEIQLP
ncbi:hypothetical protein [Merdimonas faecis]